MSRTRIRTERRANARRWNARPSNPHPRPNRYSHPRRRGLIDQRIAIGIAVVGLAIGLFLLINPPTEGEDHGDNTADFPRGMFFICDDCDHAFNMTVEAFAEHNKQHYGQPVPCESCGKTHLTRADKCVHCEKYFKMERESITCPHCGKDNTP